MFEELIGKYKERFADYYVFAISMWDNRLCLIPCDDKNSGYYPVYDKAINISEMKIENFPNKVNGQSIDAILVSVYENFSGIEDHIEIDFAEDTYDGFQPIGELV